MTVYPFILHFGPITITGYGIMMMVGFLVGGWLIGLELKRRTWNQEYAADIVVAAVIGGILGAKLWYVALTQDVDALLSRGGLVWYGGFVGGALAVLLNGWRLRVPARWTIQLAAPSLAAAYALGRVGCFLVNDDYGRPTDAAWAVRFPEGLPPSTAGNIQNLFGLTPPPGVDPSTVLAVHPTQLYEVAIMLVVFGFLWKLRRDTRGTGWLFALYLALAGTERFLIEFLRAKDDRLFGPFTVAQAMSFLLIVLGGILLTRWREGTLDPGPYLTKPSKS
jgi:phosphatidylglycerol:prolipoprotein diacylglycerol transferase